MSTKYIASNWRLPNKAGVDSYLNDNYGLTFDGSSEYITAGAIDITGDKSISVWFRTSNVSAVQGIIEIMPDPNTSDYLIVWLNNSKILASATNSSASSKESSVLSSDTWYNLVITKSAGQIEKIYINGQDDTQSATAFLGFVAGRNNTFFGATYQGTAYANELSGSISEVAIFDYTLSESQISTLYGSSSLGAGNPMSLKPAPVAYYNLADNSSGNPLTQPNEAVEDASVFDFVSNDFISASSANLPTSDYTFSAWVKISSFGDYGILGYGDYSSVRGSNAFRFESSPIQLKNYWYGDDFNHSLTTSQQNEILNNWAHVAVTYDSSLGTYGQRVMYLNGSQIATNSPSGAASFNLQNFTIGATRYPSSPEYFNGQLSNAQIWNTPLSSTEVSTLYNSGVPLTGTQPQASSLKAWYKLDQSANWDVSGSGYWDIPDASGNGNDGISSGMTSANLVLTDLTRNLPYDSYSFNFDSTSDDHINCGNPSALNITGSITLSCWVKSSNTAANYKLLIKDNGTSRSFQINTNHASLGPYVYFWTDGGTIVTTNAGTPNVLVDGNWHNLVCMFKSGDYVRMYIDGVQVGNTSVTQTTLDSSTADFIISTDGNNGTVGVDGNVSNVSVFNEALTSTEVMKLYSNGMPQDLSSFSPAPVAWWTLGSNSFFNGSNFICKDLIGSNDGTSVNAGVDALQGNTPRSEANGTGTNMDIPTNLEGSTKYSSNNSWSINMSESARVADTP